MIQNYDDISKYGKLPPQAIEVESAVLGALMLERDAYGVICDIIDERSFYKEDHGKIFEVIKYLTTHEKPVDLLMVTEELKNRNILDKVGGPLYITQLTSLVASAAHIEFHSRIVQQKYLQRQLIKFSSEIQSKAYDDTLDISDLIDLCFSGIESIDNSINVNGEEKTMRQVSRLARKEITEDYERTKAGGIPGIPTGLFELNKATGGWRSPNLITIAARPGVGKTSLMLFFAVQAAKEGYHVNIYGYEMLAEDLYKIVLSSESNVSRTNIRDGKLQECDFEKLDYADSILDKLPIHWYDDSDIKSSRIKMNTKRNVKAGKCDIVFVDYLQLVPPDMDKDAREQQISKISRTLKSITTSCKIPVIDLSQLNRDIEKRGEFAKPRLSDLRESGTIEQDSDIVIFPHRNEVGKYILSIAKHRRGECYDIPINVNKELTRFWDDLPEEYENFSQNKKAQNIENFYEKDSSMPINKNFESDMPF